jgi:hypothetical protein
VQAFIVNFVLTASLDVLPREVLEPTMCFGLGVGFGMNYDPILSYIGSSFDLSIDEDEPELMNPKMWVTMATWIQIMLRPPNCPVATNGDRIHCHLHT